MVHLEHNNIITRIFSSKNYDFHWRIGFLFNLATCSFIDFIVTRKYYAFINQKPNEWWVMASVRIQKLPTLLCAWYFYMYIKKTVQKLFLTLFRFFTCFWSAVKSIVEVFCQNVEITECYQKRFDLEHDWFKAMWVIMVRFNTTFS